MADTEVNGVVSTLNPCVMSFPILDAPKKFKRAGKEQGEAKYSAQFVLPPTHPDLQRLKAAAVAVAQAKWPGRDIAGEFKAGTFHLPFASGNGAIAKRIAKLKAQGKEYDGKADFQKDAVLLKAASKFPVRLAYIENGKITPTLEGAAIQAHKAKFFFGAEVLFEVTFVAADKVGETGLDYVTAYLNQVLATGKGARLSGGADPSETFAAYAGKASAEDPTKGLDDEISF